MTWEHRSELRADPGIAPGDRNIDPPRRRSIWPSIAVVAAASAFGGVIWFAYHDGRDANRSGMPPLVKAETGPTKIKPDNPGGQEIPYQDSTVYDRLNQNGQKPVAEKLLPPPEEPVIRAPPAPVQPADAAGQSAVATPPPPPPNGAIIQQVIAPPPQAADALPPPVDVAAPTALAPTPGAIVIQPPPVVPPKPVQVAPPAPKPVAVAVPKPEPAKAPPPTSIAALIDEAGGAHVPVAKATPAGGGSYRLQLSAVRSADAVPEEWARLKRRYPELAGMSNSTSKIDTPDKGTFYRVEAGPLDEAAAKSTCTRLRGQGLGCIVVKR
jgi:SPOR domain